MMKQIFKVTLILIIFISITSSITLAYEDNLFKFDLPSTYGNMSYNNMYVFANAENENRGMIIYVHEDTGLKKSVWDIDDSDLDKIISYLGMGSNIVVKDDRTKLGKEKAIKVILQDDGKYLELYILASNKYIYMVTFVANSREELNNEEYGMIKKSFKLKDRTTNPVAIYILIAMIGIGIKCFVAYRKQKSWSNEPVNTSKIDYKNMTEEDFKKMDE